jgi:hypothetical protein
MKKLLVYIGIVPLFVNSIANMELSNVKIHNVKEARESGLFTEQSDCGTSNLSYVVASNDKAVQIDDETVYNIGSISNSTLLTEEKLYSILKSRTQNYFSNDQNLINNPNGSNQERSYGWFAPPFAWGPTSKSSVYTIGNINVKTGYKFNVTEGTNQFAYGAGRGYTREIRNGNEVIVAKWYGIGTARGASAASRRNIPWGNVAGYRAFHGKSLAPHFAIREWQ